jgi:hypothetical protein
MTTYTHSLRIAKPTVGEENNTWGDILNTQFDKLEGAIAATATITLGSDD